MIKKQAVISAEDLYNFEILTDMEICPTGSHLVYSLKKIERRTEKKYCNIYVMTVDGKESWCVTPGKYKNIQAKWTPDGKHIVFLSNRDDKKQAQLYRVPHNGGKIKRLTKLKGEFGDFDFSPNGKTIVFSFRKKDPFVLAREKNKQTKKLGLLYRHVTRTFYKEDGYGYLPQERWHIWTLDVKTNKTKQLTEGDTYDELEPYVRANNKHIILTSNRSKQPDMDPDNIDFFIIPINGGKLKRIPLPLGPKYLPTPSPDGKNIAYFGSEGRGQWWKNASLWVAPISDTCNARNLTEKYDIHTAADTIGDMGDLQNMGPTWTRDSKRVYFQVSESGNTYLNRINISGKRVLENIIGHKGNVGVYNLDYGNKRIAYVHATMKDPGQIRTLDLETGKDIEITYFNEKLLCNKDLGTFEEHKIKTPDGTHIQGWILKPPGFNPKKKYPAILEIHGGPGVQYGNLFMHEFFYLSAQGYVIYFCNPRGSLGYGEKHTKAIWNNWGTVDYRDIMHFVSYIEKQPYIDKEYMGVTGGSYGGYMTNWIITHTNKFKAAVTQRCVSNLISMWGTSDFNWLSQYEFGKKPPWENLENYWRMSPLKYIDRAKTPTLIIHSQNDMRCSIEQGEQLYVSLKRLQVPTEMIIFPQESHGLSRMGRTDRRIARLEHIRRWFDTYL